MILKFHPYHFTRSVEGAVLTQNIETEWGSELNSLEMYSNHKVSFLYVTTNSLYRLQRSWYKKPRQSNKTHYNK